MTRYAVYFTPAPQTALATRAARWIGRDVFTGDAVPQPQHEDLPPEHLARITASARRYGFHATLKAPFRLAEGWNEADLVAAVRQFCSDKAPIDIPRLTIGRLEGFFALLLSGPSPELDDFAGSVVRSFETFRAPLSPEEFARRDPARLTPNQLQNLQNWGYPHIFDAFRFHMTLTNATSDAESPTIRQALAECFTDILDAPITIDALTLFVEPEPGSPFNVLERVQLGTGQQRKTA